MGSSETGISCIEALITSLRHRQTTFTGLTLLSPAGATLAGGGAAAARRLAGLGLASGSDGSGGDSDGGSGGAAAVQVVRGELVAIDREQRVVLLEGGEELPFDVLVLATGLEVGGSCRP